MLEMGVMLTPPMTASVMSKLTASTVIVIVDHVLSGKLDEVYKAALLDELW